MLLVQRMSANNLAIIKGDFVCHETIAGLFEINPSFQFHIKAPMYWWLDCDFKKYNFRLPTSDFEYCFDEWEVDSPYLAYVTDGLRNMGNAKKFNSRKLMQMVPLSTYVEADIVLTYQEIVEVCENYNCGEYDYKELYNEWPISREWTDFCETLMDIVGIRDILKKEGILNVE